MNSNYSEYPKVHRFYPGFLTSGDSMVYAQIHSNGTVTIKEGEKAIFKTPDANIGNAYRYLKPRLMEQISSV